MVGGTGPHYFPTAQEQEAERQLYVLPEDIAQRFIEFLENLPPIAWRNSNVWNVHQEWCKERGEHESWRTIHEQYRTLVPVGGIAEWTDRKGLDPDALLKIEIASFLRQPYDALDAPLEQYPGMSTTMRVLCPISPVVHDGYHPFTATGFGVDTLRDHLRRVVAPELQTPYRAYPKKSREQSRAFALQTIANTLYSS